MKPVSHAVLVGLVRQHDAPCLTLQVPLEPHDGVASAGTRLANAARSAKAALETWSAEGPDRELRAGVVAGLMEDLIERIAAAPFDAPDAGWQAPTRGVAVFVTPNFSAVQRLPDPPPEIVACSDAFAVRALLQQATEDLEFQVLAVHREEVRLFEGSQVHLTPLPLGDIPASLALAVGTVFDDSQIGRGFHGAPASGKGRGNAAAAGVHFHGYSDPENEDTKDVTRFLQRVGQGLPRGTGTPSGIPLVLVTLDKKLGLFRKLHPSIHLAAGVGWDPKGRPEAEIHQRAWEALGDLRAKRVADAIEAVEANLPRGRSCTELSAIGRAAAEGRVATLLLARDRTVSGRFDATTGDVSLDGLAHAGPDAHDVLDRLAAATLLHRGEVMVVSADRLGSSHAAAVLRY